MADKDIQETTTDRAPIRVLLVDDHRPIREGLKRELERAGGFAVVGETGNGTEAVALARELRPALVLLDIRLRGAKDGIQTCGELKRLPANPPRVVLISGECREEHYEGVVKSGADGFLEKECEEQELAMLLRQALRGDFALSPSLTRAAFAALAAVKASQKLFTEREVQALELLAAGKSNTEIADALHVGHSTVGHLLSDIYGKLGAKEPKREDAVARWRRYQATGTLA